MYLQECILFGCSNLGGNKLMKSPAVGLMWRTSESTREHHHTKQAHSMYSEKEHTYLCK